MEKQNSAVTRLVATAVMVLSLLAVAGPVAAQDTPNGRTRAQQVREMVLKQRETVLAQIAAILSGEKKTTQRAEAHIAAEGDDTAEISEPEGEAPEDGEPVDGESEDGEAEGGGADDGGAADEDEDVEELPETGVGLPRGADGATAALMVALGALAMAGLSVRRRSAV